MQQDSLKKINEFILQNEAGTVLSGLSCIGKTHFSHFLKHQPGFVGGSSFPILPMRWVIAAEKVSDIQEMASNKYGYPKGCNRLITKGKGKGIIILGVPWYIWKERNELRGRPYAAYKFGPIKVEKRYADYIKKIEEFNIPHIFIDSRNDYPILDKSSFLAMLQFS